MRLHPRRVILYILLFVIFFTVAILFLDSGYKKTTRKTLQQQIKEDIEWHEERHHAKRENQLERLGRQTSNESASIGWDIYKKYKSTGSRLWPNQQEKEDRILNQLHHVHVDPTGQKLKKIYLYNGLDPGMTPGQNQFIEHKCPINQCMLTSNSEDASMADAIMFKDYVTTLTHRRSSRQIWIVYNLESPYHTSFYGGLDNQVNWTATYRWDSTMVAPYERFTFFKNFTGLPLTAPRNFAEGKTKKVAWFVSNCNAPNGRELYTRELKKYVDVDIYGMCGSLSCSRSDSNACYNMLKKNYKFYLSFENSNCRDYITEKLYWNALNNDVLPIVMGAHPDDYKKTAPPMSYLHVDDFETPRHLADYLKYLDSNDTAYNMYFRWKGTGEYIDTKFWCRLCTMVHAAHHENQHMTYTRLNEWWRGQGVCADPKDGKWATWGGFMHKEYAKDTYVVWQEKPNTRALRTTVASFNSR